MHILVTGGAGYIGSHTCLELLNEGHQVTVFDSLINSSVESLRRVAELSGKNPGFHRVDLCDKQALSAAFQELDPVDGVIHFAGLKAVGDSVAQPLDYYYNNITATLRLCEVMAAHGVKNIIFSSSATVYGIPASLPITEDFPFACANPYGRTKRICEEILTDLWVSDNSWRVVLLRYFNPVGAHESGRIGEDSIGITNNLMPYISQVAAGIHEKVRVFGNDYETVDGTGVRDYIHVVDLALGHLRVIAKFSEKPGVSIYNLGRGQGYSVLQMIRAFEETTGQTIPYAVFPRRPGDIAEYWADPTKVRRELGWQAVRGLEEMCRDSWNWQSQNPRGYRR